MFDVLVMGYSIEMMMIGSSKPQALPRPSVGCQAVLPPLTGPNGTRLAWSDRMIPLINVGISGGVSLARY